MSEETWGWLRETWGNIGGSGGKHEGNCQYGDFWIGDSCDLDWVDVF